MTTTDLIRAALLADVREAAATFRRYEEHHRAKWTNESLEKAEVNAALAARLEATIDLALSAPPEEAQPVAVSSSVPVVSGEACERSSESAGATLTQEDVEAARNLILDCTGTDFISGKCKNKGDRSWVYRKLCEAVGLLQGDIAAPPLGAHASQEATRPDVQEQSAPDVLRDSCQHGVPYRYACGACEVRI